MKWRGWSATTAAWPAWSAPSHHCRWPTRCAGCFWRECRATATHRPVDHHRRTQSHRRPTRWHRRLQPRAARAPAGRRLRGAAVFLRPSGRAAELSVGRPMARSFPASTLIDLLAPSGMRATLPVDLFHSTDYRVLRMACPVVATLHDALPISHPEWCNPRLRGLKNWLQIKAAQKADHVIAHTAYSIEELVRCFGVDQRRISVVPAGVDEAWLERPAEEDIAATLAEHGLRPGYYLFVGTLQPRKNGERLLAAYLALPPVLR